MHHTPRVFFEDVDVGHEVGPAVKTPTGEAVLEFCRVWGHDEPNRFTSADVARREGLPGPIVPGIMSMAYMAQLLSDWATGGALRKLDVVFRQLVPHERPLHVAALVTDKREEDGQGLVELDVMLQTPEGDRYVGGKAVVALPRRSGQA